MDEIHPAASDRERLVALAAAPLAAAVALVVTSYLIAHDPPVRLRNGQLDKLHASVATYHLLELVLLALALVMLAAAWYRKRLFIGIAMALYGLAVFNLHYWGFGVPFLLGGAWYLVRAYRRLQAEKQARAVITDRTVRARPPASRRYTPPA
jgi:hypothetical protein